MSSYFLFMIFFYVQILFRNLAVYEIWLYHVITSICTRSNQIRRMYRGFNLWMMMLIESCLRKQKQVVLIWLWIEKNEQLNTYSHSGLLESLTGVLADTFYSCWQTFCADSWLLRWYVIFSKKQFFFFVFLAQHKFPWEVVKTTKNPAPNALLTDSQIPISPYEDDEITVVPAVVVVAVLATPIILVFVALIIQHFRLKGRVRRAAQRRTLDTYSKGGLCTCCCATPKYYYDSKRGFDKLIKNSYELNAEETSTSDEEEENDLFTRKA